MKTIVDMVSVSARSYGFWVVWFMIAACSSVYRINACLNARFNLKFSTYDILISLLTNLNPML